MKRVVFVIALSLILVNCASNESEEIITQYEAAHNSHDIEGSMSMYHDDIEFELKGTWVKIGSKAVRELAEWDAALNSNLRFTNMRVNSDSIYCEAVEKNDWFKAAGIDSIIHNPVIFILDQKKIKKIIAFPSEKVGQQVGDFIGSVFQWSETAQDPTIHKLIVDEEFLYSREAAAKWMDLFKRMKEQDSLL